MNTKARVNTVRRVGYAEASGTDVTAYNTDNRADLDGDLDPYVGETTEYTESRPPGLFSTSGRAAVLGGTVSMLLIVMSLLVWLLSTRDNQSAILSVPGNTDGLPVGVRVGQLAPDFELVDVRTNQNVRLLSLRGKPVFINFWGTWCPPCRAEMPEMQKVYSKYEGQLTMIGVSMGPRDTVESVKSFVDSYKYTWTFLQDDNFNVATVYQAYSIPTSYFIDPSGVIRAIHIGAMDSKLMEGNLEKAR